MSLFAYLIWQMNTKHWYLYLHYLPDMILSNLYTKFWYHFLIFFTRHTLFRSTLPRTQCCPFHIHNTVHIQMQTQFPHFFFNSSFFLHVIGLAVDSIMFFHSILITYQPGKHIQTIFCTLIGQYYVSLFIFSDTGIFPTHQSALDTILYLLLPLSCFCFFQISFYF